MDVVVLGAGVIGLTAALELSRRSYKVTIVGKDLPEDSESVGFASPWAGCNWHSFETSGSTRAAGWDRATYQRLKSLAAERPELCTAASFVNVCPEQSKGPWFQDLIGDFTFLDKDIPGGRPFGYTYTSYLINAPMYLRYLSSEAKRVGIRMVRRRVASLAELYNLPGIGRVDLVVNASGLGAPALIGVEDKNVYPARGQTVLVHAPDVKRCIMSADGFGSGGGDLSYIIPRPGPDGHVVLGGTYLADNYSSLPDLDEAERILKDCFQLEPRLAGADGKSWEDIRVVSHNVGLRPARRGGARVELEKMSLSDLRQARNGLVPPAGAESDSRQVAVVHAYGFGGTGYQASVGASLEIAQLVDNQLAGEARARL